MGYHNDMCIKLKTGQVDKSYMYVWGNNAQLSMQVHDVVSLHNCSQEEKSHST